MTDQIVVPVPEVEMSSSQRQWAGWVHIAAVVVALFTSWAVGLGGMCAAIIFWLIVRNNNQSFATLHAAEAFNFNFSMFIYTIVGAVVGAILGVIVALLTIGIGLIVILPAMAIVVGLVMITWIVCSIMAAMAGFKGDVYRYPFTIRILSDSPRVYHLR